MKRADRTPDGGYRTSHLGKGPRYDRDLDESPLDAYFHEHETRILRRILPKIFPTGISRYLDFACGTGRITRVIEDYARESHAVDISAAMVAQARHRSSCAEFVVADITVRRDTLPGPYELVTAFRFFANAESQLREEAMEALAARTAVSGYLILNHHRNPGALKNRFGDAPTVDLTHRDLSALCRRHGFRIVRRWGIAAWVLRARWRDGAVLSSRAARALEPVSRVLPAIAPDSVILARHG